MAACSVVDCENAERIVRGLCPKHLWRMQKNGDPLVVRRPGVQKGQRLGSAHPLWRGDGATYRSIHQWAQANFEDPGRCEACGATAGLEWSRNHGNESSRSRELWRRLCRHCHRLYDARRAGRGA